MLNIVTPLVAKKFSPYVAISLGGAISMDTTLPLVRRLHGSGHQLVRAVSHSVLCGIE